MRPVRDEVERPALVWRLRHSEWRPRAGRTLAAAAAVHRQALLPVQPIELFVVHDHALAREQDPEPAVAEAAPPAGEHAQTRLHRLVATPLRPAHRLRIGFEQPADMTLRGGARRHEPEHRLAPRRSCPDMRSR
jgi:hypothetical protein